MLQQMFGVIGRLEPKNNIICSKITSGSVLNKLVQLNRITKGVLGRIPQIAYWTIFVIFREKIANSVIWMTFHTFSETFERTKLLKIESCLKEQNLFGPLPLPLFTSQFQIQVESKTRLNASILESSIARPRTSHCPISLLLINYYSNYFSHYIYLSCVYACIGVARIFN